LLRLVLEVRDKLVAVVVALVPLQQAIRPLLPQETVVQESLLVVAVHKFPQHPQLVSRLVEVAVEVTLLLVRMGLLVQEQTPVTVVLEVLVEVAVVPPRQVDKVALAVTAQC